jgi:hypothetical protein
MILDAWVHPLASMPGIVVGMLVRHEFVVNRAAVQRGMAGLLMNGRAGHAQAAGDRVERKHGYQEPDQ